MVVPTAALEPATGLGLVNPDPVELLERLELLELLELLEPVGLVAVVVLVAVGVDAVVEMLEATVVLEVTAYESARCRPRPTTTAVAVTRAPAVQRRVARRAGLV